jgi:hypothetical protein
LPLVIQSIANYELIGGFKPYVIKRDIYQSTGSLVQEGANAKTGRVVGAEMIQDVVQCHASIYNVLDHEYVLSRDAAIEISGYPDHLAIATIV